MVTEVNASVTCDELSKKDMKLKGYKEINFYADSADNRVIYAEYVIPSPNSKISNREKLVRIDSEDFESYIRMIVHPKTNGNNSVGKMIQEIKDYFINYGCPDVISTRVRTAGKLKEGLIEYDLCNHEQQYVVISPGQWDITTNHTHKFLKRQINSSQVLPQKTNKTLIKLLQPFVNATKPELILLVVWLVQAFCQGSHSILMIMAGRGSGKSVLTKMLRRIIDPSKVGAGVLPLNEDHLLTTLTNSYVVAFDNTDELRKEQSDILCLAVTGATYTKRASYSTNNMAAFDLHNTLIINGIDILPSESDLAERCLLLNLIPITTSRKTESEIDAELNEVLPEIMGAIFDTLSKAMEIIGNLTPQRLPRMAESYVEMLSIAMALGLPESKFEKIYFDNLHKIDKARSEIAIVQAVREYMTNEVLKDRKLSGTITEVYNKIKANYSGDKKDLPNSPSRFSRKLSSEHAALFAAGYIVNIDPTKQDHTYIDIIKK